MRKIWKVLKRVFSFFGSGFLLLLLCVILLRAFVAEPFVVRGNSMEPTFFDGDYLWIEKVSPHFYLKRGEVVVFKAPDNPYAVYIKRIIGLPGERVRIVGQKIYVSSEEGIFLLIEPYIKALTQGSVDITLGEDEYFVLGDNRTVSEDSRMFGPIKKKAIIGRAWIRIFPFAKKGVLPIVSPQLKRVEKISVLQGFSQSIYSLSCFS